MQMWEIIWWPQVSKVSNQIEVAIWADNIPEKWHAYILTEIPSSISQDFSYSLNIQKIDSTQSKYVVSLQLSTGAWKVHNFIDDSGKPATHFNAVLGSSEMSGINPLPPSKDFFVSYDTTAEQVSDDQSNTYNFLNKFGWSYTDSTFPYVDITKTEVSGTYVKFTEKGGNTVNPNS